MKLPGRRRARRDTAGDGAGPRPAPGWTGRRERDRTGEGPPGEDAGHALAATPPGTPPLAFPHDPFDGEALDWDDEMGPADEDDLDGDDLDHDVPATVDELAVLRALVAARPNQSRSSRGRRR
ncbi:MAG: hypothetical protein KY438_09340 [Actinobacteria bacterium]|nr:hypothetical protein [Actinomycetota bacterium]